MERAQFTIPLCERWFEISWKVFGSAGVSPNSSESCFWIDCQLLHESAMPRILPQCGTGTLSDQQTGMSCQLRWSVKQLGCFVAELPHLLVQYHQPRTARLGWCIFSEELELSGRLELNGDLVLTKCVNEEMVLDLVHIPKQGQLHGEAMSYETIQEIHPPTGQATVLKYLQYTMGSGGRFS